MLGLGAFGRMRGRSVVVNVVVGSLCGVSGLLGRVRDTGRVEGSRVLGSAWELSLGIHGRGLLEVVTTPGV